MSFFFFCLFVGFGVVVLTMLDDNRLRGARQTNAVVKEFWLACRGSNFMYVS